MDIDKLDRTNFRHCLEAMARPGKITQLLPYDHSAMMAMASMLLYSEVRFFQEAAGDWEMIKAITGSQEQQVAEADYLFLDQPTETILDEVKVGDQQNPEFSATLICGCRNFTTGTRVILSGPGIEDRHTMTLPVSDGFLFRLAQKNKHFPLGIDLFFIADNKSVCAIPRTTMVKLS